MSPRHAAVDDPLLDEPPPAETGSLAGWHAALDDPRLLEAAAALGQTPEEALATIEAFGLTLDEDPGGHNEIETVLSGHPYVRGPDDGACRHRQNGDVMFETLAAWIEPDPRNPEGRWEFRLRAICRCGTDFDVDPGSARRPAAGGPGVVFEMHPLAMPGT